LNKNEFAEAATGNVVKKDFSLDIFLYGYFSPLVIFRLVYFSPLDIILLGYFSPGYFPSNKIKLNNTIQELLLFCCVD